MRSTGGLVILVAATLVCSSGCSGGHHVSLGKPHLGDEFVTVRQPDNELANEPPALVAPSPPYAHLESYPLRVGDQLEFTLSIDPQPYEGAYRLRVNDAISVEYLHEPAADRRARVLRVLPNGEIDLPLIGPIRVAGKTVDEATQEINERAREYYRFPQIVLAVSETSQRAEELRRAFTSGFNNQSFGVTVNPDGTINLPEIGTVHVAWRTLPEVREEVQGLYAQLVPGVRIWPHLTQRAPDQVYVLGQVLAPGRYLLDRPTHVSQAVAQAGGWTLGAELRDVVLIRYREGSPRAVKLDLHSAIHQDYRPGRVDLRDDILLADGDVVVIPRDKIQNVNDMIRRVFSEGVYGVIPTYDVTVGRTPLR